MPPTPTPYKTMPVLYKDQYGVEACAALVIKVHPDGTVNLVIFPEDGGLDFRHRVHRGKPGQLRTWHPGSPPA